MRRLSCVQLDSIAAVERSHRIVLGARVGHYPRGTVSRLLGEGRLFEFWAHAASLVPIEDWPLFTFRMAAYRTQRWYLADMDRNAGLSEQILARIREEGPLGARHFEGRNRPGSMWGWKPAKEVLEALFATGELVIARRDGFQRIYDLPERVVPVEQLTAPMPSAEGFYRGYIERAVRARGVLTEGGIVDHCRFQGEVRAVRPHVDALVSSGLLRRFAVEDGGPPVVVAPDVELDVEVPRAAVLLSPFDNLVWDRAFLERVFGFHYRVEIYTRPPERVYGYYVLPLLVGDRLVGRADLKTDRRAGVLRLLAFHREPGVRQSRRLEDALERALTRLAAVVEVASISRD